MPEWSLQKGAQPPGNSRARGGREEREGSEGVGEEGGLGGLDISHSVQTGRKMAGCREEKAGVVCPAGPREAGVQVWLWEEATVDRSLRCGEEGEEEREP
jgi:hypothetical protein